MIECQNICKSYGELQVVKDVSFRIAKGELACIVGPSGAGKSTLLHIIGTLDKADYGDVLIEDLRISQLLSEPDAVANFRNKKLGFVFQFHHLLPEFTALENVCIPAYIAKRNHAEASAKAKELLDFMGLAARMHHKPNELSGGEQQRVSVARALINNPLVVLADEPTGNLDSERSEELHQLFFNLKKQMQQTFVIVTHNNNLTLQADRVFSMKDGMLIK